MAKLADASDLGSDAARRGGSSPSIRTIYLTIAIVFSVLLILKQQQAKLLWFAVKSYGLFKCKCSV